MVQPGNLPGRDAQMRLRVKHGGASANVDGRSASEISAER